MHDHGQIAQSVNGAQEGFYNAAEKIDRFQKILIKYSKMTDNTAAVKERLDGITSYVLTASFRSCSRRLRFSAFILLKNAIEAQTGRGLARRVLDSSTDTQDIEKVLRFVATLVDEFKVSVNAARLRPHPDFPAD